MRTRGRGAGEDGFTLIEALVALALTGLILSALATLTAQWLPSWNRGFERIQQSELISLAMQRIAAAITTVSVWGAGPDAAPEDVLVTWQQLIALHRQWHSLTKELREAEQALGHDNSEANYLRLLDVKARMARMDGTEALIEGFGASSGRGVRSL